MFEDANGFCITAAMSNIQSLGAPSFLMPRMIMAKGLPRLAPAASSSIPTAEIETRPPRKRLSDCLLYTSDAADDM
eukprot:10861755-Alexandrium_andersonii.AAC.1